MISPDYLLLAAASLLKGEDPPFPLFKSGQLVRFLVHHEVAATVCHQLHKREDLQALLLPKEIAALESEYRKAKLRYRMVKDALQDALALLHPLDPLFFKGLAIGEYYEEPWLRNPGDLDLAVRKHDFSEARDRLVKNGWCPQPTVHQHVPKEVAERYGFAAVLRHPKMPVIVDLHRDAVDRTEPFPLDGNLLFTHSIQGTVSGMTVRIPSPAAHMVLASMHSVRHGYFRMSWFYDLYRMNLGWRNRFSAREFLLIAEQFRVRRAAQTGLELMNRLFRVGSHPLKQTPVDTLTRWAIQRRSGANLLRGHMVKPGSLRRLSAMIDLVDHPGQAGRYLTHLVFPSPDLKQGVNVHGWSGYARSRVQAAINLAQELIGSR